MCPPSFATVLLNIYFTLKPLEETVKEFIFSKVYLQISTLLKNDFFCRYFKDSKYELPIPFHIFQLLLYIGKNNQVMSAAQFSNENFLQSYLAFSHYANSQTLTK